MDARFSNDWFNFRGQFLFLPISFRVHCIFVLRTKVKVLWISVSLVSHHIKVVPALSSKIQNILTLTKNASLLSTDFLAMIYKNEQPRTTFLCRACSMLESDFNLICR